MKQFDVKGMSCAACSARVEKAVSALEGVTSCSVSLLTNSMGVEGTASEEKIIKAVRDAGYDASVKGKEKKSEGDLASNDEETRRLRNRLISSLIFLSILLYFSMGHMMANFPIGSFLEGNCVAQGLLQLLLTAIVMVINQKFFISGSKGLLNKAPNMDTLVSLGSLSAFIYSTWALFRMTAVDEAEQMALMNEFYFESAAMILTLITVGKMLESRSKGKTTDALKDLMRLSPKTAVLDRGGEEIEVPIEEVNVGDIFIVKPGASIPVDGIVIKGESAVDESALTGESMPVDKAEGDKVSAATINRSGALYCKAERVGEDTTLSQIIKLVSDSAATKAPIARVADKVSYYFVPSVIIIALITTLIWLLLGRGVGYALARGISVLVISCPCALGLATPVAIMVGSGLGAKNGILFKTAAALEKSGRVEVVALDKTGTITSGSPVVTDILPYNISAEELLVKACSLEKNSEHPLSRAVISEAERQNLEAKEAEDFEALTGSGVVAKIEGERLYGGSLSFISALTSVPSEEIKKAESLADEGKTPLLFASKDCYYGLICVSDVIREDSAQAISELKGMGIKVVMLTGDNERTAKHIGREAGVDEIIAGLLPGEKEKAVKDLKKQALVAMVGDGINDAPALTSSDLAIAIGAGSDVAIDAAEVVLMKSELSDVSAAVRLGRATLRNIHQNLFWAFFYNALCIPLASGLYARLLGWSLNPMFAAAAMSLSSFCVVTNALRLNLVNVHDSSKDKKRKPKTKETHNMEKTMNIEGMMCSHCEATVKKALEAIEGVSVVEVSHEKGTAVVKLEKPVSDEVLKEAVEKKDYKVLGIK